MKASRLVAILLLLLTAAVFQLAAQQAGTDQKSIDQVKAITVDAGSEFQLGLRYHDGEGVPQDFAEAVKWYRKAAEQNDAVAQANLALCYERGQGVAQNAVEAVKWWRKAAEQNLARAQYNLGLNYAKGEGVARNYVEAYTWWLLAARQGDDDAKDNMTILEKKMTPDQIAEGQKVASNFKAPKVPSVGDN